jgi:hypothetical protein
MSARPSPRSRAARHDVLLGYTQPMELQLSEAVLERLAERAKSLGLRPEELASAAVADFVTRKSEAFEATVQGILEENAELFRRLA